jgi:hypothetical protein
MDIPRLSPRSDSAATDLARLPGNSAPGAASPILKQGESHDSSLSASDADEVLEPLQSSAPVVHSKTPGVQEKSPTPPPEGRYGAAGVFHYKDGTGQRDYYIPELIMDLLHGVQADLTAYPEMVRYKCFDLMTRSKGRADIRQLLKDSITSD